MNAVITKKKPTTIREIAKLADVSYQTVSLVINGKPGVSEKTRKRILRLMQELDYHPIAPPRCSPLTVPTPWN